LHKLIRALALVGWITLAAAVLAPGAAFAQYREFTGRIDKINDKKMIVDNRQGDKVTFDKVPDTKIDDTHEAKKAWSDLKSDDWVTVKWKMVDKPRKAYEVIVLPPKARRARICNRAASLRAPPRPIGLPTWARRRSARSSTNATGATWSCRRSASTDSGRCSMRACS
jgi:hypothetical protein